MMVREGGKKKEWLKETGGREGEGKGKEGGEEDRQKEWNNILYIFIFLQTYQLG